MTCCFAGWVDIIETALNTLRIAADDLAKLHGLATKQKNFAPLSVIELLVLYKYLNLLH